MAWRIQATYVSEHDPDFVYSLATIGLISGLELWLGIIVACMPTIPPVLQTYVRPAFQRLTSYYNSRRSLKREERSSSHKPVPSDEFQLNRSSRETLPRGHRVGASSLSTEASSFGRGANFVPVQDSVAGMPGIYVHRKLDRQEEYRDGMVA